MIQGYYTAATGLAMQWERQETIANNLANVDTVGYKRDDMIARTFGEHLVYAVGNGENQYIGNAGSGVNALETVTDFSPGELRQTGNTMDLALEGDGFFVVETPQGERLTRNGSFSLDSEGYLVNHQGYKVLGEKGPINLKGSDMAIGTDGKIEQNGQEIDQLRVVKPQTGTTLLKEGESLYKTSGNLDPATDTTRVRQGFVEASNVQVVIEMVRMIEVSRAYETSQKVLAAHDSALEKAVNDVGRIA